MLWRLSKIFGLRSQCLRPSQNMVVLMTGCDSGLGFRAALDANAAGLTVIAGFLQGTSSEAAVKMKGMCFFARNLHQIQLDVTKDNSVINAVAYIEQLLANHNNYVLHAVVNNAGVMVFGDFEWQTFNQIEQQLSVNLIGTMRVSKAVIPMLRKTATVKQHIPRLIIVGSHCAIQPLPTLSVYASTKCALKGWCEALRMELKPYGVNVISFIPGSLVASTNIAVKQNDYAREMKKAFTNEQLQVYGKRFDTIALHLSRLSGKRSPDALKHEQLMEKFMGALLEENPSVEYKEQPWRYAIYHFLFGLSPTNLRHWLVNKFSKLG